eukprot:28574-Heterocapsa_arctica.AAC.1
MVRTEWLRRVTCTDPPRESTLPGSQSSHAPPDWRAGVCRSCATLALRSVIGLVVHRAQADHIREDAMAGRREDLREEISGIAQGPQVLDGQTAVAEL